MIDAHPYASSRSSSEDETLPDLGALRTGETSRVGRAQVVTQLLADVRTTLQAMPDGKIRRELRRKVESLQFVVDCWGAMPPRAEQLSAMLETLLALREATEDAR